MKVLAQLVMKNVARRVAIVEAYLDSIAADEPELVRSFENYALAHRCTDKLMKITARRIEEDNRRLTKLPPRQVLFGNGPLAATEFEVLCGVPLPRNEVARLIEMKPDDRANAMAAHFIEFPEHRALFHNWLKKAGGGQNQGTSHG